MGDRFKEVVDSARMMRVTVPLLRIPVDPTNKRIHIELRHCGIICFNPQMQTLYETLLKAVWGQFGTISQEHLFPPRVLLLLRNLFESPGSCRSYSKS